jgi:hypothetical protein
MTLQLLAQVVMLVLYLSLSFFFVRNIWRSLRFGHMFVFADRVDRCSKPGLFWIIVALWAAVVCILCYGFVLELSRAPLGGIEVGV